jgi:nucleoside-diphosphate-sugar epimerase
VELPDRPRPVLVIGATSIVGRYLLPRLRSAGHDVHAVSRRPAPSWSPPGVTWHRADIARGGLDALGAATLVHLAPLWLAPPLLPSLIDGGLSEVVAFGSTSRFTNESSPDPREQSLAARLAAAEVAVEQACATAGVGWTILRPTLIYGGGFDRNLSTIAGFVRRFGFFPVADGGRGRRQPVHAEDLAAAAMAALERSRPANRAYDLPGGSTLSYREMVVRICEGVGCRPRIVSLPRRGYRIALTLARLAPRWRHLSRAMGDRMTQDLCFSDQDAARDLGFTPRPFTYPPDR